MFPLVFPLLAGAPAVTAFIGTTPVRAYRHGSAPQGVVRPYVTWSVPGGEPQNTFEGAAIDLLRVQVDCWAEGDATGDRQVELLAAAVRAALEPAAYLVAYVADGRDSETGRFRIGMSFDFFTFR